MVKFWVLILVVFLGLLFTVNYVSRRSSQVEPPESVQGAEAAKAPVWAPQSPQPFQAPRSDAPSAGSGALYKCIDGKGHHSFQSQPCPGDSTQAWVRDATPEPEPRRAEPQRRAPVWQPSGPSGIAPSNR